MKQIGFAVFLSLAVLAGTAGAAAPEKPSHSHVADITVYEGSKTCAGCHPETLKDFALSLHYQQLGDAPFVVTLKPGAQVGMMGSY
jgi:hypothetical protein